MTILSVIIYWIFLKGYKFLAMIGQLFNPKIKKWYQAQKSKDYRNVPNKKHTRIWVHAASLGEFEQARSLIELLKKQAGPIEIILSFFSPSGYEIRKKYPLADFVCYLPLDSKKNSKKFIQTIDPDAVVFVKYELWHYYLKQLSEQSVPTYLISALFRPNQIYFKNYGGIFNQILPRFNHIFVQNSETKNLLTQNGIFQVSQTFDTRIDRAYAVREENRTKDIWQLKDFKNNQPLLLLGSSYETEENWIKKIIEEQHLKDKIIIAPHNIDEKHIKQLTKLFPQALRWTQLPEKEKIIQSKILILDTIGLLQHAYKYASVAFIGGGFNKSIHNILEPATFGIPIIFGPNNHQNFIEAVKLIKLKGAFLIHSYEELKLVLEQLSSEEYRKKTGSICSTYINERIGSSAVILEEIKKGLQIHGS